MELTDLHVHSTASDGTFTPSELVAEAKRIGLKAFALTDHDTVAGVKEATAAADEAGIELIPGIEISTKYNSTYIKDKEVHIVGLYIDYTNEHFLSEIAGYRDNRDGRNDKLIELMNEAGMSVSLETMRNMFGDDLQEHILRATWSTMAMYQAPMRRSTGISAKASLSMYPDRCRILQGLLN